VRKEHKTIEMASRKSRCGLGTTSLSVFYRLSSDLRPQRSAPCFFSYFYSTKLLCPGSSTQFSPAQPIVAPPLFPKSVLTGLASAPVDRLALSSFPSSDIFFSPPGRFAPRVFFQPKEAQPVRKRYSFAPVRNRDVRQSVSCFAPRVGLCLLSQSYSILTLAFSVPTPSVPCLFALSVGNSGPSLTLGNPSPRSTARPILFH
jgi:hypothetical protein